MLYAFMDVEMKSCACGKQV